MIAVYNAEERVFSILGYITDSSCIPQTHACLWTPAARRKKFVIISPRPGQQVITITYQLIPSLITLLSSGLSSLPSSTGSRSVRTRCGSSSLGSPSCFQASSHFANNGSSNTRETFGNTAYNVACFTDAIVRSGIEVR
jgi:hypothetical protein